MSINKSAEFARLLTKEILVTVVLIVVAPLFLFIMGVCLLSDLLLGSKE